MQNQQSNTSTQPLVSFIIAYYDVDIQLLCECIDSILALSLNLNEREIIVVDDGSSQSPLPQLQQKYADQVAYIRQSNGGLSIARNTGLRMASAEYLQFVDADDCLVQAPYDQCLDIVRHKRPDMLMFDFTIQHPSTDTHHVTPITHHSTTGVEYMSHSNIHAMACGYLFKRSILGELRFTPGIFHEDEEFTPQLLLRAECVVSTDAKAYFYRQRPHSITTERNVRTMLKRLNDTKQVIGRLDNMADTMPPSERHAMQRRVAQLTMDYIYNIIVQTQNEHYLNRRLKELHAMGLFPLPDRDYTTKYKWFRRFTNNSLGRSMLMKTLPKLAKER